MAEKLLDYSNSSGKVYADCAYQSKDFLGFLAALGFIEKICKKGYRNKPLSATQKRGNRTKSRIRSRVEHVFGMMKISVGDLTIRTIGIARARAKIGLMNLAYNMRRGT